MGPIDLVFGHNDLLAANLIDDGSRLWLVDWDYGGWNSPLFDLGGLASNSELPPADRDWLLEAYFDRPLDDELRRRAHAMLTASLLREAMWSMVSEVHSELDFDFVAYTAENLARFERAWAEFAEHGARMTDLPTSARVVIVGGGIVGCSVAYHLGKLGWTDVLLLEQGQLTSGSTWHAAGLVGQLRTSANITQLLGYSVELYGRLEAETGQATGWKRNGGLRLACTPDRWTEVRRQATTAHSFGLEMHLLSAARGAGAVAADDGRGRGGRRVPAHRRPGQPVGHHPGPGQGRAHGRRDLARRRRRSRASSWSWAACAPC